MTNTPETPLAAEPGATTIVYRKQPTSKLGVAAFVIALVAWLITAVGIVLVMINFNNTEGEFGFGIFAIIASIGIALFVSVPIGTVAFVLAFISFFMRNRGKVFSVLAFIFSLPFAALAVFYVLLTIGIFGG